MTLPQDALWYKDAIIYQVHVRTFHDSNGDGIGDFRGLAEKLDYLQELGINALWLMPFFPSPLRDDGYDIADYRSVHPSYGTLDDFKFFLAAAHQRGIRVIIEMVLNHTSDQHPWFQESRSSRDNPRRDWYVWSDTDTQVSGRPHHFPRYRNFELGLGPGFEVILLASFFQPPARSELRQSGGARRNVGGDAVLAGDGSGWLSAGRGSLSRRTGRHILRKLARDSRGSEGLRGSLDEHFPGRMLLAEANQWPADLRPYFGDGDEFHMAFHFPVMPRMFMSVQARRSQADHRYSAADSGYPDPLPVVFVPTQPRRTYAGDGDRH